MDVVSVSPLRVTSVLWQPQRGGYVLTVIAKATFALQPGEAVLAPEQEYPNDDDNYWNDDPQRSMYSPTDLVPFKARPEVMLVGHAFSPRNEGARSLVARLVVAGIDKSIEVTGDRTLLHDGQVREPVRFARMPLRWERSGGGPDSVNPVGLRADAHPDAYGSIPLPNLSPPGHLVTSRAEHWIPVCFGPIAPMWPSRWQKLGRHATRYQTDAWNDSPLPDDVDPSYFNAAPEDQRPAELRDTERLLLENLHPDHPRLVTTLPGVRPAAFVVDVPGQAPQRIHMECDTLWIDTDRSLCTLTWRGPVPLVSAAQPGRVVVALEEGAQRLSWSDVQRIESGGSPRVDPTATPISDGATVDVVSLSSARAALLGMSSASAVNTEGPRSFPAPTGTARPADMPSAHTAVAPSPGATLTDVNLSAVPLPPRRARRRRGRLRRPPSSGVLPSPCRRRRRPQRPSRRPPTPRLTSPAPAPRPSPLRRLRAPRAPHPGRLSAPPAPPPPAAAPPPPPPKAPPSPGSPTAPGPPETARTPRPSPPPTTVRRGRAPPPPRPPSPPSPRSHRSPPSPPSPRRPPRSPPVAARPRPRSRPRRRRCHRRRRPRRIERRCLRHRPAPARAGHPRGSPCPHLERSRDRRPPLVRSRHPPQGPRARPLQGNPRRAHPPAEEGQLRRRPLRGGHRRGRARRPQGSPRDLRRHRPRRLPRCRRRRRGHGRCRGRRRHLRPPPRPPRRRAELRV
ncbi:MAG: DUF2169 domain-containing protein [Polyangiaceae bacterium]